MAMANEEAPRSCRPSSSLNKKEAEALKRAVATLSRKVNDMQKEWDESKVVYIKKRGLITFAMREAMAENVVAHATSFAKAYDTVVSALRVFARPNGLQVMGEITSNDAKIHAAISSVAMRARLCQHVAAWEMAAVVSGDQRETTGTGLKWCEEERARVGTGEGPFERVKAGKGKSPAHT